MPAGSYRWCVTIARASVLRTLAGAAALALTCALGACGGGDPVADALEQQTVTVSIPDAIGTSTAPSAPQGAPAAPGGADAPAAASDRSDATAVPGPSDAPATPDPTDASAAPDPTDPPAGGNGALAPAPNASPPTPNASTPASPAAAAAPAPRSTIHLVRSTPLRDAPGGRVIGQLTPTTEFRSPTVLAVVRAARQLARRARSTSCRTGGSAGSRPTRMPGAPHALPRRRSLGRREVVVRRDGRVVQRFPVAIGSAGDADPDGPLRRHRQAADGVVLPPPTAAASSRSAATSRARRRAGAAATASRSTRPTCPRRSARAASLGCLRAPTRGDPPARRHRAARHARDDPGLSVGQRDDVRALRLERRRAGRRAQPSARSRSALRRPPPVCS